LEEDFEVYSASIEGRLLYLLIEHAHQQGMHLKSFVGLIDPVLQALYIDICLFFKNNSDADCYRISFDNFIEACLRDSGGKLTRDLIKYKNADSAMSELNGKKTSSGFIQCKIVDEDFVDFEVILVSFFD
jgi:hypothetical protein